MRTLIKIGKAGCLFFISSSFSEKKRICTLQLHTDSWGDSLHLLMKLNTQRVARDTRECSGERVGAKAFALPSLRLFYSRAVPHHQLASLLLTLSTCVSAGQWNGEGKRHGLGVVSTLSQHSELEHRHNLKKENVMHPVQFLVRPHTFVISGRRLLPLHMC